MSETFVQFRELNLLRCQGLESAKKLASFGDVLQRACGATADCRIEVGSAIPALGWDRRANTLQQLLDKWPKRVTGLPNNDSLQFGVISFRFLVCHVWHTITFRRYTILLLRREHAMVYVRISPLTDYFP